MILPPITARGDEPTWTDSHQSGPFVSRATFPLHDYERLLADLPELQRTLTRTLGVPAARQPIHIYLFADAAEHQRYIEARFPKFPYRQALFIQSDGESGVYAYRHPALDVDLRHECTHALLHAVLFEVPLWLDEGIAEYFEMPPSQRAFDHPNYESLRWNMRLGMVRSVETLEDRRELADMNSLDYRYSWAWVHFMLHGPEAAHRTLVEYLAELRQPADGGRLSKRLEAAMPNSSERLVQHFKHWRQ
ncbi:MAG: hypothetical protein WD669_10610 [Pirellulales bacterium]